MFTASRVVVVDDRQDHIDMIQEAFRSLGTPCLGLLYKSEIALNRAYFEGVRALFMDLHLLQSLLGSDEAKHYALIAAILEDNIAQAGGPFILIVWTENAHLVGGLKQYLDKNLDPAKPYAHPIAVLALPKDKYLNLKGDKGSPDLKADVQKALSASPQLCALLQWESDVIRAAAATLTTLMALVPPAERKTDSYPAAVDALLSRLAVAAVGAPNVEADKHAAVNAALAPILADRIQNITTSAEEQALWASAVTRDQEKLAPLDVLNSALLNSMLHLARAGSEAIRALDWGAVVEFPKEWVTDDEMKMRFGVPLKRLMGGELKIPKDSRAGCNLRLVRIGAECDHAQGNSGPIPYLFAVELPANVLREQPSQKAEWITPVLVTEGEPFFLVVHSRYLITVPLAVADKWTACYRLRSSLISQLVAANSSYASRPGIISIDWKPAPGAHLGSAPPCDTPDFSVEASTPSKVDFATEMKPVVQATIIVTEDGSGPVGSPIRIAPPQNLGTPTNLATPRIGEMEAAKKDP